MHVKGLAQDQTQATAYHSLVMVGNITQILWPSVILTIRKKKNGDNNFYLPSLKSSCDN